MASVAVARETKLALLAKAKNAGSDLGRYRK
jgi:hypothetical protein